MPLPMHLGKNEASGLIQGETIAQYELGTMRNFIYLIIDWTAKEAAIVDPQKDLSPLADLARHGIRLTKILLTHSHHDHVAGVPDLLALDPALSVYVHSGDQFRLKKIDQARVKNLSDGETVFVGAVEIAAIHTPGHSIGEISYHVKKDMGYLLTGDTLFIRDCGRADFETGSDEELFQTIQRLKKLPDSLVMLPGHHYANETASEFGKEKISSPPLLCKTVEELRSLP